MWKRIIVGDQERVIVIRKGRLGTILTPGTYWYFVPGQMLEFERHSILDSALDSNWTPMLVREHPELVEEHFLLAETNDREVALVWVDGKLSRVLGAGEQKLFWKGLREIRTAVYDTVAEPAVPSGLLPALLRLSTLRHNLLVLAMVEDGKAGLLFLDQKLTKLLEPGVHAFWNVGVTPRVELFELRTQTLEIHGQEILTEDKVTIRVNIWAEYRIADPVVARRAFVNPAEHVYKALQLAVRQSLGTRRLDTILQEKVDIDPAVAASLRQDLEQAGIRLGGAALKDIVLPGDIRDILNQVVAAEKQAQANLIRRREETAATRSLLNTARLLEENPILVRLKELETLEKVAEKVEKISIVGGLENLLRNTVTLDVTR